jgi:hypothetical protein
MAQQAAPDAPHRLRRPELPQAWVRLEQGGAAALAAVHVRRAGAVPDLPRGALLLQARSRLSAVPLH